MAGRTKITITLELESFYDVGYTLDMLRVLDTVRAVELEAVHYDKEER